MSYLFLQSTYMHYVFVVNYYFTYIRFVLNMTVHGCIIHQKYNDLLFHSGAGEGPSSPDSLFCVSARRVDSVARSLTSSMKRAVESL